MSTLTNPFPPNIQDTFTQKLYELETLNFDENVQHPPCVTCHMSLVTFHVSHVMCRGGSNDCCESSQFPFSSLNEWKQCDVWNTVLKCQFRARLCLCLGLRWYASAEQFVIHGMTPSYWSTARPCGIFADSSRVRNSLIYKYATIWGATMQGIVVACTPRVMHCTTLTTVNIMNTLNTSTI